MSNIPRARAAELIKDGRPYRSCCGTTLDQTHLSECVHYRAVEPPKFVDMVNLPPHYNSHPSGVEHIDIFRHMTANAGTASKYVWRHELKQNPPQDLEKAMWHLKDAIAHEDGVWLNTNHMNEARTYLEKVIAHERGLRRDFYEALLELDLEECLAVVSEMRQALG